MVLIYSRDADSFVNKVIDYLKTDFIKIGDLNKITLQSLIINSEEVCFSINGEFFSSSDLNRINAVWFNGGIANTQGSTYENECYSLIVNTFLNKKKICQIGKVPNANEINKIDIQLIAKDLGIKIPETFITNDKTELSNLTKFVGGDGKTRWTQGEKSGKDTYEDTDGNGHYNEGDCVHLDDGRDINC